MKIDLIREQKRTRSAALEREDPEILFYG